MSGLPSVDKSDELLVLASDPLPAPNPQVAAMVRLASWQPNAHADIWDAVSPDAADLIVVPWLPNGANGNPESVSPAMDALLERLPYYAAFPHKHVLLDNSDLDILERRPKGHLFKTSANYRSTDIHALHYNVQDPGSPAPIINTIFDVCFQGAITTHPIRQAMNLWRYGWTNWQISFEAVEPFWTLPPAHQTEKKRSYVERLRASRFVLCPRGRGLNSRRFFEALAYGRVPILYADAAKLPLERRIPWERIVVRVPEGFGRWTNDYVARFLAENDLQVASQMARQIWLEYFAPSRLRAFIVASLRDSGALPP